MHVHVAIGRVNVDQPDLAAQDLAAVHAALDDAVDRGARRLTISAWFLQPIGFAFIEAERIRGAAHGVEVEIELDSKTDYPRPFAEVIGFGGTPGGSKTTIPLQNFRSGDEADIMRFIADWNGRAGEFSSVDAGDAMTAIGELFENGLSHARSSVGVVSCGQFFPKRELLHLGIVDLGIGIPGSLAHSRNRLEKDLDAAAALRWAFEDYHSSRKTSRGRGLARVKSFVARTGASLHVFSGTGYAALHGAR